MREKVMTGKFEAAAVLGRPMIFTCLRVDCNTVPNGMYNQNEIQHENAAPDPGFQGAFAA